MTSARGLHSSVASTVGCPKDTRRSRPVLIGLFGRRSYTRNVSGSAWRAWYWMLPRAESRIQADANSSDPAAQLRALDADAAGAAKAVRRAEIAAEVARQTLRDAEARERGQRLPLFEIRATAIAKRLDEKLDALAEIVDEAVELAVQARAAGVPFDAPIYPGLLPERIEYWRSQQQAAGRLA